MSICLNINIFVQVTTQPTKTNILKCKKINYVLIVGFFLLVAPSPLLLVNKQTYQSNPVTGNKKKKKLQII